MADNIRVAQPMIAKAEPYRREVVMLCPAERASVGLPDTRHRDHHRIVLDLRVFAMRRDDPAIPNANSASKLAEPI